MLKRTKIVCTLGPASEKPEVLEKMFKAGMDLARLNFSHGTQEWHGKIITQLRKLEKKFSRPIGIIADLQGPRIRVGELDKPLTLVKGEAVVLVPASRKQITNSKSQTKHKSQIFPLRGISRRETNHKQIPVTYTDLVTDVKSNEPILIADGLIELKVLRIKGREIIAKVVAGGILTSGRGMNFPASRLSITAITEKDKDDLRFALKQGVDFIALSFVRNASDIKHARELIPRNPLKSARSASIISKIEMAEAVKNFAEILGASDAIMIARGDLGIEMPPEDVPIIQKEIIEQCLKTGKPAIVATQMLESMIKNPRPTRAEASDVANAVIDHTDATMLSEETATGQYPAESVEMMAKIIKEAEASRYDDLDITRIRRKNARIRRIAEKAKKASSHVKAILVVCPLRERCSRAVSRLRPELPIFTPCDKTSIAGHLTLSWAVYPFTTEKTKNIETLIKKSKNFLLKKKLLKKKDRIMLVEESSSQVVSV